MKPLAIIIAFVVSALLIKTALSVHWILVLSAAPMAVVIVIVALVCAGRK